MMAMKPTSCFSETLLGVPQDKYAHFGISATAHTTCSAVGKTATESKWGSAIVCFAAVNAATLAKAIYDVKKGSNRTEKTHDEIANVAGTAFSMAIFSIAF